MFHIVFGIENFIAKIDTYQSHQMKRARQTDRSLELTPRLFKVFPERQAVRCDLLNVCKPGAPESQKP